MKTFFVLFSRAEEKRSQYSLWYSMESMDWLGDQGRGPTRPNFSRFMRQKNNSECGKEIKYTGASDD